MEQDCEERAQGPLMSIREFIAVIGSEELGEEIRMDLRLKETAGESSLVFIILRELQVQQARIDQILEQLALQNQLLEGFQVDMLRQLQENTKAALREQLTEMNKQRMRDLREIKEAMDRAVRLLVSQERRIGKIEGSLEAVLKAYSKQ